MPHLLLHLQLQRQLLLLLLVLVGLVETLAPLGLCICIKSRTVPYFKLRN